MAYGGIVRRDSHALARPEVNSNPIGGRLLFAFGLYPAGVVLWNPYSPPH